MVTARSLSVQPTENQDIEVEAKRNRRIVKIKPITKQVVTIKIQTHSLTKLFCRIQIFPFSWQLKKAVVLTA